MVVYRKIRLESASNGAFQQYGLLLMNSGMNIAFIPSSLGTEALAAAPQAIDRWLGIEIIGAVKVIAAADRDASNGVMPMSFATVVHDVATYFPCLEGMRAHLVDNPVTVNGNSIDVRPILAEVHGAVSSSEPDTEGIAVKAAYTTNEVYTGFSSYHHNQRVHRFNTPVTPDKPWRIGVELEVYARNRNAYNIITGARSNWFQCESDGSLTDRNFGGSDLAIELKTIPLRACDAKSVDFWAKPMKRLAELARSKGTTTTGLHVHIGKEILGGDPMEIDKTLAKLNLFYVYMVEDDPDAHAKNVTICGREQGYSGSLAAGKSGIADNLKKYGCLDKVNEQGQREIGQDLKNKCQGQRWDINIGPLNSYGTIEFRKADGRISKTRLAAVVTWWEQMVLYCKETPWHELNFNSFFRKVTAEYPCVAYFFNQDEEA